MWNKCHIFHSSLFSQQLYWDNFHSLQFTHLKCTIQWLLDRIAQWSPKSILEHPSHPRRKFHTHSPLSPPTSPSLGNHRREHWVLNKRPEVCFTWVFCLCDVGQAAEPFRMYCADVIQEIGLSALNSCLAGLRGEKIRDLGWLEKALWNEARFELGLERYTRLPTLI